MLNFTLGTLIGAHRIQMGLSQRQVAQRLGVSQQYLGDIENDRRTPTNIDLLKRLSRALQIELDVVCFAAGVLPPDLLDRQPTRTQVVEAFKAMREIFGRSS